jgi:hypothetical protein
MAGDLVIQVLDVVRVIDNSINLPTPRLTLMRTGNAATTYHSPHYAT